MSAKQSSAQVLDLDEIQARAEAADAGPWDAVGDAVVEGPRGYMGMVCDGFGDSANRDFVAHARTDVPALIAEVRRLRADAALVEKARAVVPENNELRIRNAELEGWLGERPSVGRLLTVVFERLRAGESIDEVEADYRRELAEPSRSSAQDAAETKSCPRCGFDPPHCQCRDTRAYLRGLETIGKSYPTVSLNPPCRGCGTIVLGTGQCPNCGLFTRGAGHRTGSEEE